MVGFFYYFIILFSKLPKKFLINLFNGIENFLPCSSIFENEIKKNDIVFLSPCNWHNRHFYLSPEIEFAKAAKKLSITSIVYQLSLDNFSAREILHCDVNYVLG